METGKYEAGIDVSMILNSGWIISYSSPTPPAPAAVPLCYYKLLLDVVEGIPSGSALIICSNLGIQVLAK